MATEKILVSPIDHAAATPALLLQPAAAAPAEGSTRMWGWMATTARAVGGACLHVLESPATGTIIFTSVTLSLWWQQKNKARRPPVRPLTRSMSIAMLQGGDKAMQRFKRSHDAAHDEANLRAAIDDMRQKLTETRIDFAKLYTCVGAVEMSGKENEAIKLLEEALKKQKEAKPSEHAHEVHELELLLVEMNIYKENYKKALDYECMKRDDNSSADARVHLYRAVIYTMMNNQEQARKSYEKMREIRSGFHGQKFFKEGSSMTLDVADFDEFAEVVKRLMQEIHEAKSGTPAAKAQESQQQTVAADEKAPVQSGETAKAPVQSGETVKSGETTKAPVQSVETAKAPVQSVETAKAPVQSGETVKSGETAKAPVQSGETVKSVETAKAPVQSVETVQSGETVKAPVQSRETAKAPVQSKETVQSGETAKAPVQSGETVKAPVQ